jgi:RNase H-fold protein (predicted Holliday junction resolvase)
VCHLWNLVAGETREGYVYKRLLSKLATEHQALKGKVFDVLGLLFDNEPLHKLLVEAIRYGDDPKIRAKLDQKIDNTLDQERVQQLIEARSLATHTMDISQLAMIREDMERYQARRLQPYYIKSFFVEAFRLFGGAIQERENGRYRISHVPARIRDLARELNTYIPILRKYDRVCFDKDLVYQSGYSDADFICPGHPLLDTLIKMTMDKYGNLLQSGSMLIDKEDYGKSPRVLFFLEQSIQDASDATESDHSVISQEVHFVEIDSENHIKSGGAAPHLDYHPTTPKQRKKVLEHIQAKWLQGNLLEKQVLDYAIDTLVPKHLNSVRQRREGLIEKTLKAVNSRLTKEINFWDRRATDLRKKEKKGKSTNRLNADRAQDRADNLAVRLEKRTQQLELEKSIFATPPLIIGGALIIPIGMLEKDIPNSDPGDKKFIE